MPGCIYLEARIEAEYCTVRYWSETVEGRCVKEGKMCKTALMIG